MHDLDLHSPAGTDAGGARGLFGLSLCAGAGGLDLGLMLAEPGYRAVGYVERDAFAATVLVARMEEEALDQAPVWDDVATFDGHPWRGVVDIISGGYPCQPFSIAGQRRGADDPRHLWPHIARIIGECAPEWVFLENVANHLNIGYREVRGELEGLGFHVTEGLFTAAEVGAPHRRQRLFVLAHAERGRRRQPAGNPDPQGQPFRPTQRQEGALRLGPGGEDVGDAHGQRRIEAKRGKTQIIGFNAPEQILGDPECTGRKRLSRAIMAGTGITAAPGKPLGGTDCLPAFPPGPDDGDGWRDYLRLRPEAQPAVRRSSDGLAHRVDRLRLCGNGVVPLVAAHAWRTLKRRFGS